MDGSLSWLGLLVILWCPLVSGFLGTESTSYYGCYSTSALSSSNLLQWRGNKNTIEACLSECRMNGNFLGAVRSTECWCGEVHDGPSSMGCYDQNAYRCADNAEQICGGYRALSMYAACEPGYRGSYCNISCSSTCGDNRVCQVNSASCTGFCYSGWKNAGENCLDACTSGKYGPKCAKSCPERCANGCNSRNGMCIGQCTASTDEQEYKGPYCLPTCLTGTYGSDCEHNCLNCVDEECDEVSGSCTKGCKTGWTGDKCDACRTNYYGEDCNSVCSTSCKDQQCEADGRCKECYDGSYQDSCTTDCPQYCDGPCKQDSGQCYSCVNGHFGVHCFQHCNKNCKGSCDQDNGKCFGCKVGFYGQQCNVNCSTACAGACNQETGVCDCTAGYYGATCEEECPANCATPPCHKRTGHCITGCQETFYGLMCEQKCPCGDQCDKNGNCPQPTEKPKGSVTPGPQDQGPNGGGGNGGLIGGVVGGILLLAVVAALIVFFAFRFRRRSTSTSAMELPVVNPPPPPAVSLPSQDAPGPAEPVVAKGAGYYDFKKVSGGDELHIFRLNIKSIASHIQRMEQMGGFKGEYGKLSKEPQAEWTVAIQKELKPKNKFKQIYPYDHNRVVLQDESIQDGYINASHITGYQQQRNYIAAQGATPKTLYDFLYMIVEQRVETIVMVTNLYENGSMKCQQYWPGPGDDDLVVDDITVTLTQQHSTLNYVIRKMHIKKDGMTRSVQQYHYLGWPDHGVPDSCVPLLRLRELVLQHTQSSSVPTLVHCSAGIGRTGTFIALDILLRQAKVEPTVNVPATIKQLRQERINMVQTQAQYEFLYRCLAEGIALGTLETDATNHTLLKQQYQALDNMRPTFKEEDFKIAKRNVNKDKNRTMNILPPSKNRVILMNPAKGRTDYINAVTVNSYTKKSAFIVTQIPLEETVVDFWTMIMDYKCSAIVFIQPQQQQAVSWLPTQASKVVLPDHEVCLGSEDTLYITEPSTYANTGAAAENQYMNISEVGPSLRSVALYQIPVLDPASISEGYNRIKDGMDTDTPAVVVCLDGCDESGVFVGGCVVKEMEELAEGVSVVEAVQMIRDTRPQLITHEEQFLAVCDVR